MTPESKVVRINVHLKSGAILSYQDPRPEPDYAGWIECLNVPSVATFRNFVVPMVNVDYVEFY